MRTLAAIALISAVFAAGITTNSVSASARDDRRMDGGGDRHFDRGDRDDRGFNNFGGFGLGVLPFFAPYYQPDYDPYYQPYGASPSCWRWSHLRHHRVWVCGRYPY